MSRRRFYAILVSRIDPEVFKGMFLKPDGTYRFCREEDERVADALTEHFKPVLNGRKITAWCIYERRSELGLLAKGYEEGWKTRRENRKRASEGKPPLPRKPRVRRSRAKVAEGPTLFDRVEGQETEARETEARETEARETEARETEARETEARELVVPSQLVQANTLAPFKEAIVGAFDSLLDLLRKRDASYNRKFSEINRTLALLVAGKIRSSETDGSGRKDGFKTVVARVMPPRI